MSQDSKASTHADRRADVRIAGRGSVDAAVVDEQGRPIARLDQARVANVSAGGIAIDVDHTLETGQTLRIDVPADQAAASQTGDPLHASVDRARELLVRIRHVSGQLNNRCRLHCQLTKGAMPASLMYGWDKAG